MAEDQVPINEEFEDENSESETCGCDAQEVDKAEESEQQTEVERLKNELAAVRADQFNYRQRMERERAKARKLIVEDKIGEFLPVLDNLDRALAVPEEGSARDVLVGVRMVQRQFLSVLENSEVSVIPTEGMPFDPQLHDAVETEYVSEPAMDGMILSELLRGYRTPERVLRPSQVRVGKLKE